MSTRTAEYRDAIEHLPAGSRLIISGVSWEDYEDLLEDLAGKTTVRVLYDEGTLEIMSPLLEHEVYKELISYLVRAFADEKNLPLESLGSTTWKLRQIRKGTEPDACFYVTNAYRIVGKLNIDLSVDPPPDIVVEIDTTSRSRRKFAIYAALHVPEIWRSTASSSRCTFSRMSYTSKTTPAPPLSASPQRFWRNSSKSAKRKGRHKRCDYF